MTTYTYPFNQEEASAAYAAWGCNCGPTALAFALQTTLAAAHYAIQQFDQRKYTSPTMMREALATLHRGFSIVRNPSGGRDYQKGIDSMFAGPMSLVRIQWTGPWTAAGMNARWAVRQTHWIATWKERGVPLVFDCNGGIMGIDRWEGEMAPAIVATIPRADGGWFPANVWRINA